MPTSGWYDGLTPAQLEQGVADYLRRRFAVVVERWGAAEIPRGGRDLVERLELGERAVHDARRENSPDTREREDCVIAKALAASSTSFLELIRAG